MNAICSSQTSVHFMKILHPARSLDWFSTSRQIGFPGAGQQIRMPVRQCCICFNHDLTHGFLENATMARRRLKSSLDTRSAGAIGG
jgi:hypothetical protein